MKRRNADCAKLRRPLKRGKITEGVYGSTFLYLKFLMVWALVLVADFILELRFEYLWPFWLMLRSVYDSYKYQGLAFSVFFVCIAITSDVICYLFIPVQWLFFAASTYVWVQYVWHTERGICLPTLSLWLLFVYIEASVRLRELRTLPFNLDLCRPFAAHCIGYPVVTLGFGFKSYISYKIRVRKQKDVQKENEFHIQLLQKALPPEQQQALQNTEKVKALTSKSQPEEVISNGAPQTTHVNSTTTSSTTSSSSSSSSTSNPTQSSKKDKNSPNATKSETPDFKKAQQNGGSHIEDFEFIEQSIPRHSVNDFNEADENDSTSSKSSYTKNSVNSKSNKVQNCSTVSNPVGRRGKSSNIMKEATTANNIQNNKDDYILRLESDIKRVRCDLQQSRNVEQDLRAQITTLTCNDKTTRNELYQLRQDNESLQNKLHNLVTSRQQDKQNLAALEKKLLEEKKLKASLELQISAERKAKKADEQATARAVALAAATRTECTEMCKQRRRELENESKLLRRDLKILEDQVRHLEIEAQSLRQFKEQQSETDVLMSALAAMQDKNTHLENSLSAETRLKLDLFSALGEAKRQIEIKQDFVNQKDRVIAEWKSKYGELMSLLPANVNVSLPNGTTCVTSSTDMTFTTTANSDSSVLLKSTLNPNASDYTPKLT